MINDPVFHCYFIKNQNHDNQTLIYKHNKKHDLNHYDTRINKMNNPP